MLIALAMAFTLITYSCVISYWTYSRGCLSSTNTGNNMRDNLFFPVLHCKMQRWWKNENSS